jgi:hypothetical protein
MKYILLCIIAAIGISAFSQNIELNVKGQIIELKTSSTQTPIENIVDVFKDKEGNDVFVYHNHFGYKKITEGQFSGNMVSSIKEGIAFMDGSRFEFDEDERYICNIDGMVYTEKRDLSEMKKHIYVYSINNRSVTKLTNTITIDYYFSITKISNGNYLIFSDLSDVPGGIIRIYDSSLNNVLIHEPFSGVLGYNELHYTQIGSNIIISFERDFQDKINSYKVVSVDTQNGYSIKENFYEKTFFNAQNFIPFSSHALLICVNEIQLFNEMGERIWTKKISASPSEFSSTTNKTEDRLFIIAEGSIVCLSMIDGSEIWRKPLSDIYRKLYPEYVEPDINRLQTKGPFYRLLDHRLIYSLDLIGFLSAKRVETSGSGTLYEGTFTPGKVNFSDFFLTLYDYDGVIVDQIPLSFTDDFKFGSSGRVKPLMLEVNDNGFRIIGNQKISSYEK